MKTVIDISLLSHQLSQAMIADKIMYIWWYGKICVNQPWIMKNIGGEEWLRC